MVSASCTNRATWSRTAAWPDASAAEPESGATLRRLHGAVSPAQGTQPTAATCTHRCRAAGACGERSSESSGVEASWAGSTLWRRREAARRESPTTALHGGATASQAPRWRLANARSQRTHHVSAASSPNRSAPGSAPRRTLVARSSSAAGAAGRLPGRGGSPDAGRASSSSAAAWPRFAASANGAEGALGPALFSVGATKLFKQNVSASGARPAGGGSAGATERRRDPPYMAPERARGVRTFEFGNFTRSLLMSCCFSYGRRAVER